MKIVIDLDRALAEGRLTPDEAGRLRAIAATQTSFLAANLVTGFGIVAVAGGLVALFASVVAVGAVGLTLAAAGAGVALGAGERWRLLSQILLVVGSLMLGGGLVAHWEGSRESFLVCLALFAGAGLLARNTLLVVLAVLSLAALLGARAGHWHATYALGLKAPGLTILAFTGLGAGLYALSRRLPADWGGLAIAASRTCVLLVNLGFWIGSLWGDRSLGIDLPPLAMAVGWALAIAGGMAWAWRAERRWLVVTAAVFGGIHFFTQWFALIGASPVSVVLGGLLVVAAGYALRSLMTTRPQPA